MNANILWAPHHTTRVHAHATVMHSHPSFFFSFRLCLGPRPFFFLLLLITQAKLFSFLFFILSRHSLRPDDSLSLSVYATLYSASIIPPFSLGLACQRL
ncbi:membrane-associated protein, putative [Bodo saltans]|uniref:Membrane-associated protein, putative n=1 Tax=Bodo saltans TaxID=75058 RepID=A0A0S4IJ90_BODSA|nr:membrane-associated protein, putative [Bodo saltans]|eukprot:CUE77117.1 membrane-associated protein, putative [Bodo saltans]